VRLRQSNPISGIKGPTVTPGFGVTTQRSEIPRPCAPASARLAPAWATYGPLRLDPVKRARYFLMHGNRQL
jgi:hypothetical protein